MNHPYFEDFIFKIEDNEEKEEKLSRNRSRVSHKKLKQRNIAADFLQNSSNGGSTSLPQLTLSNKSISPQQNNQNQTKSKVDHLPTI